MHRSRSAAPVMVLALGVGQVSAQVTTPSEACVEPSEAAREEAQDLFEGARDLLLAERWVEAEAQLDNAVRLDATHALARYGLGEARLGLMKAPEALAAFLDSRAAWRCIPSSPGARDRLRQAREEEESSLRDAIRRLEKEHLQRFGIPGQEANGLASPSEGTLEAVHRIHAMERRLNELHETRDRLPAEPPELAFALGNAYFQRGAPPRPRESSGRRSPRVPIGATSTTTWLSCSSQRGAWTRPKWR